MMLDRELTFSDQQGPFNTGTNASTNHLDRGVDDDFGKGEEMWIALQVATAPVGSGSTMAVRLVTDDEETFTAPRVAFQGATPAISDLPVGTMLRFRYPSGLQRYSRLEYIVANTNQSARPSSGDFVV